MKIIVDNIRMTLEDDEEALRGAAAKKLGIGRSDIKSIRVLKESVDARRKPDISLVYSVLAEVENGYRAAFDRYIRAFDEPGEEKPVPGALKLNNRPIIIGSGPAGMFAGLVLARHGYRPLVLERGECVERRVAIAGEYWQKGALDAETNVQFGEGGAGTFSDGKLTTRINDRRCGAVLEELHASGAPSEILYKAKPHIGSDNLRSVVVNMRKRIESLGGEVRFKAKLTSVAISEGSVTGAVVNGSETIPADVIILAIGHSARDTFEALLEKGIPFVQKPFSIGVRIEHPQEIINLAQYGTAEVHPRLGAADYQLFCRFPERTVYTFCMCPGGTVVASASEPDSIVTNGMSDFARDRENANSALVVSVNPEDFGSSHPLAGVEFQRKWERLAFEAGGRNGSAPVQRLGDFLEGKAGTRLGSVKPSYTGRVKVSDIHLCLPGFVTGSMKRSMEYFDRRLRGFGMKDAVLTGVETRTSSPVRIPRGDTLEAIGVRGLYPAGEGAGYAGGIVSAAVDGIRVAEQVIRTYRPIDD